ncbi:MAG: hypothetical protein SOX32_00205 [Candidatus Choladocola sp.]|nr:hypothetical protein [Candidatus Choladocola sp.]
MNGIVAGFMAIGLEPYWSQFEGMREKCEYHHQVLKGKFDCSKVRIEDVGIVDSEKLAREAGKLFAEKKVDVIFCHMLTYASSVYIVPVIRELNVPFIILNVQYRKALDYSEVKTIGDWLGEGITCAGVPEATAVLSQMGKKFSVITGHMEDDSDVADQINSWCDAIRIKNRIARHNLGYLGRSYAGMMDLCVNESRIFDKFGTFVHHLDWQEIIETGKNVDDTELKQRIETVRQTFELEDSVSESDIDCIARTAEDLRKMTEKYSLNSWAFHYEFDAPEEQTELLAALNPAMTMLMTEGTACVPEGDIRTAIAMIMMKMLAGNAMTAELYSMDFNDGTCLIGHSGACDAKISSQKAVLKMNILHGKAGKGYVTQFYPEPGPVTMAALTEDRYGNFKLIAVEGMSVEGPRHHGVLVKGHYLKQLEYVADALDIEFKAIRA